jgi:rhodanese-related sulfurtransferase
MLRKILLVSVFCSFFNLGCSTNINAENLPDLYAQNVVEIQSNRVTETTPEFTSDALMNKTHVVIDVREQDEYDSGHIKDVKLIPMSVLSEGISKLDKNLKYITVCHSGRRSAIAAGEMEKIGLNVLTMKGGMVSWESKGLPVVKPGKRQIPVKKLLKRK